MRYEIEGRTRTHFGLLAALATGKVTFSALRKAMRAGGLGALGNPRPSLEARRDSDARLSAAAEPLARETSGVLGL